MLYKSDFFLRERERERENKVGSDYEVLCASRFISIGAAGIEIAGNGTRP
jgi:hypothetical protein